MASSRAKAASSQAMPSGVDSTWPGAHLVQAGKLLVGDGDLEGVVPGHAQGPPRTEAAVPAVGSR